MPLFLFYFNFTCHIEHPHPAAVVDLGNHNVLNRKLVKFLPTTLNKKYKIISPSSNETGFKAPSKRDGNAKTTQTKTTKITIISRSPASRASTPLVAQGSAAVAPSDSTPLLLPSEHSAFKPPVKISPPHTSIVNSPPAGAPANTGALLGGAEAAASAGPGGGGAGADYKITLGRPRAAPPPAVTSTNPKTPSPSLNGGVSSELDKVCAESVQDLMATIAKLDSNGVQVVPERSPASPAPSPAPHVHSSTDPAHHTHSGKAVSTSHGGMMGGASDPNEDWCAVCMDGGELMCCDKCPKVFHQYCHIPTIEKLPDETETWQCLLCVNFAELPAEEASGAAGGVLSPRQQKLVERITLELYCQYEASLAFREPVAADNMHYHSRISRPMCLDMIRMRLVGGGARYSHPDQFVADCRLMFRNAKAYNPPETQIYKDAIRLEEFFDAQLLKWLPEYAYWNGEGTPPLKRARLD